MGTVAGVAGILPLADDPPGSLDFNEMAIGLGVLLASLIATGMIVLAFRRGYWFRRTTPTTDVAASSEKAEGDTFVRSVLALWLVIGVLVLAVMSFALGDTTLRSTLVGGITASAGGAIAFYFSSKAASEARRDLISANANELTEVPDLLGKTLAEAQALFAAAAGLTLEIVPRVPAARAAATDSVVAQSPQPGVRVGRDTAVQVTLAPPVAPGSAAATGTPVGTVSPAGSAGSAPLPPP